MSNVQRARELADLIDKATPGPWEVIVNDDAFYEITCTGWQGEFEEGIIVDRMSTNTQNAIVAARNDAPGLLRELADELTALQESVRAGEASDGHHTHNELYAYRQAYNAALFNTWSALGLFDVHKSKRHSSGGECFGGGWFIVVAETPRGQISNHYRLDAWGLFDIPERELPNAYDGHTPNMALGRLLRFKACHLNHDPQTNHRDPNDPDYGLHEPKGGC